MNLLRNLQWETLSAGLFGLAGGLAVIAVTRDQINITIEEGKRQRKSDFNSKYEYIIEALNQTKNLAKQISPIWKEYKENANINWDSFPDILNMEKCE